MGIDAGYLLYISHVTFFHFFVDGCQAADFFLFHSITDDTIRINIFLKLNLEIAVIDLLGAVGIYYILLHGLKLVRHGELSYLSLQ